MLRTNEARIWKEQKWFLIFFMEKAKEARICTHVDQQ